MLVKDLEHKRGLGDPLLYRISGNNLDIWPFMKPSIFTRDLLGDFCLFTKLQFLGENIKNKSQIAVPDTNVY